MSRKACASGATSAGSGFCSKGSTKASLSSSTLALRSCWKSEAEAAAGSLAPLDAPYGRGINFQIALPTIRPILDALASANWPLFMQPEEKWYRAEELEIGVRQFLVQDPDGYLIRFSQRLETRPYQGV
jgi:hypothetical protein